MKKLVAMLTVVFILGAAYHLKPGVAQEATDYWESEIERFSRDEQIDRQSRQDSLLVMAMNFRAQGQDKFAEMALVRADGIVPDQPMIQGLIGLFHVEAGDKEKAIASWKRGGAIAPNDPNLPYLATLDTSEIQYVDIHMLEKLFVDSLINARLDEGVYHPPDYDILGVTERKIRIEGSVNWSVYLTVGVGLLIGIWSIGRIKKSPKKEVEKAEFPTLPKPVGYMVIISCAFKIGHILAALFNFFMLGSDLSEFISLYISTPENLITLFKTNYQFVTIFVVIMIIHFVQKKWHRQQQAAI